MRKFRFILPLLAAAALVCAAVAYAAVTVTVDPVTGDATVKGLDPGDYTVNDQDGSTVASFTITSAPVAAFSSQPATPAAGQQVTFDGSATSCAATPCRYHWHDVGSAGSSDYPLGPDGVTSSFTFRNAGTKYVELVVTDAQGRTSRVEHDVTVTSASPTPTATPSPSPTQTPSPSGPPLWQDGFEHAADGAVSNFVPPWAGLVRSFADRVTTRDEAELGFSPRAGSYSLRMTANNADTNSGPWSGNTSIGQRPSTGNSRAQLQGPYAAYNRAGADTYYHVSIRVPTQTLPVPPYFGLAVQWHGTPFSASPNFALNTSTWNAPANTFSVGNAVGSGIVVWQDSGTIQRNVWYDFTFHIKWSYGSDGYFELWKNGVRQTLKNGQQRWTGQTLKGDQSQGVAYYASNYRDHDSVPGDVTYFYDAMKVGASFDSVQP